MNESLTKEIKEYAKKLGADIVGIADVDRFKNAPKRMSPIGLLPNAKSVIVCGIHHLDASVELGGEPTPHNMGPYGSQSSVMNPKLDDISFLIARFLEDMGFKTLPIVSSNIWRYKDLKVNFAPDIAHRYSAVCAGLGEIGWSKVFLTKKFGPRQRLHAIITDLEPDPLIKPGSICKRCMECVNDCPSYAIPHIKENKKIQIKIDDYVYELADIHLGKCTLSYHGGDSRVSPFIHKDFPGWNIDARKRLRKMTDKEKYDVVVIGGGIATIGNVYVYLPLCDGKGDQVIGGIAEELLKLSISYGYKDILSCWKEGGNKEERKKVRYKVEFNPVECKVAIDASGDADVCYF